jgi:hypothetical protein
VTGLAFVVLVVAVAAPLCGHQNVLWPHGGRIRALWARRARCTPVSRPQPASRGSRDAGTALRASQTPSSPSVRERPL